VRGDKQSVTNDVNCSMHVVLPPPAHQRLFYKVLRCIILRFTLLYFTPRSIPFLYAYGCIL